MAQGTKFFTALSDEARLIKFLGVDQVLDAYAFKTFTRDKHPIAGEQNSMKETLLCVGEKSRRD